MIFSTSHAALRYQRHGFERASTPTAKAAASPKPVKRMPAFATCMAKGLEQYWNVPANDPRIRAEIDLLPKRML